MLRQQSTTAAVSRVECAHHNRYVPLAFTLFFMRSALRFLLLLAAATAAQAFASDPAPLWKTDVRQFGYESFPLPKMEIPVRLSVAFIDDKHLAIAWITPDRTTRPSDAAHVHVVVVDSSTGQKQVEKEWATLFTYRSPVLTGVSDAKFMICTDDALRILSATLDLVKEEQLPSRSTCRPSPSGRTVVVVTFSEHSRQIQIMQTDTFNVLSRWTEERHSGDATVPSISDHWLLGQCGEPTQLCVRRFNENWRALNVTGVETFTTNGQHIPAEFISDQVFVIRRKTATIATVDGTMLFQTSPPDKRLFGRPPVPSSGGEGFVMVEGRLRGIRNEFLDMYPIYADDRAVVVDVKDHRSELSVKLRATSPWTRSGRIDNVVALSPNGASLALSSDGVLELFSVPIRSVEGH